MATIVDGTGTTSYTYHVPGQLGAGQVATVDGPLANDVISYRYDELGRVASRAIDGVALTLTYDALGRVEQEVNALGTFGYTYDGASGRLATVTYPNNPAFAKAPAGLAGARAGALDASGGGQTSAYSYFPATADHRLQTIHHKYPNGATLSRFDYTYDPVGNIQTWRQQADSTAVTWEYRYDNADQLIRAVKRAIDPQGSNLQRFAYGYDPAGNRLFEQIDDRVTAWTYDRLNRLVTQQAGGLLRVTGTVNEAATVRVNGQPAAIDGAGLFVGGVQVAPGTTRFTVTATDASGNTATQQYDVDQVGVPKTFTFDANGNLTSDGTRILEWDGRNQLVAATVGTHRTEFIYDGQQRRVRVIEKENSVLQSDTKLVWCQTVICEERGPDGVTVTNRAFSHGDQASETGRYFAADHLGSVTSVADGSSTVLTRYTFDPWGRRSVTGTDSTSIGYTGHRWHWNASGWLTHYRLLDPATGRWATQDPLGLADGVNLYAYVANNPLRSVDPDGRAVSVAITLTGVEAGVGAGAGVSAGTVIAAGVVVGGAACAISPACRREAKCVWEYAKDFVRCKTMKCESPADEFDCRDRAAENYRKCRQGWGTRPYPDVRRPYPRPR